MDSKRFTIILAPVLASGCGAPGNSEIVAGIIGPGDYSSLPPVVAPYVAEEEVSIALDPGVSTHTGDTPPNLAGAWELSSMVYSFVYDDSPSYDDPQVGDSAPYKLRYEFDGTPENVTFRAVFLDGDNAGEVYQEMYDGAIVTGTGKRFSVFGFIWRYPEDLTLDADQNGYSKSAYWIVSGEVAAEGLIDVKTFTLSRDDIGESHGIDYKVWTESDGIAKRLE